MKPNITHTHTSNYHSHLTQFWQSTNNDFGQYPHGSKQQPFYGPLSGTTRVRRYQKKHSSTHHPDHHPIFISFLYLPWSTASSLFKLCASQYFDNLFPCPLWSTSWSGALHLIFHTFLHPISVFFSQHMSIPSHPHGSKPKGKGWWCHTP